ncbi:MAG: HD domain-containing protein [Peptococcaceae bacterium]|jgi:putative hydrolase of HD superfamily|nr:HD domain-containing protein [Peptococcaceae bacterium]
MSISDKLVKQIEFIKEIDKLKTICRQSVIADGSREENDAEHSWHLAVMAMVLHEYANDPQLDLLKVIKMVLIHDIVEIDAGDTFIYDVEGNSSKLEREEKAARRIFGILPKEQEEEFLSLWREFEAQQTAEAKFAAVMDRLEPLLLNSLTKGHTWNKYGIKSNSVLEKNLHVKEGSVEIWHYINDLIEDCIEKGILER